MIPVVPVMGDEVDSMSFRRSEALGSRACANGADNKGSTDRDMEELGNGLRNNGVLPKPPALGECVYRNILCSVFPGFPLLEIPVIDSPSIPAGLEGEGLPSELLLVVRLLCVVVEDSDLTL